MEKRPKGKSSEEMNPALFQQPFFQVTLPIVVTFVATIWLASWSQNKRLDEMNKRTEDGFGAVNKRLDEIVKRLDRIEAKLEDHTERIVRLEARTSPIAGVRG